MFYRHSASISILVPEQKSRQTKEMKIKIQTKPIRRERKTDLKVKLKQKLRKADELMKKLLKEMA